MDTFLFVMQSSSVSVHDNPGPKMQGKYAWPVLLFFRMYNHVNLHTGYQIDVSPSDALLITWLAVEEPREVKNNFFCTRTQGITFSNFIS